MDRAVRACFTVTLYVVRETEGRPRIGLVALCSGCAEGVVGGLGWKWDDGEAWVVRIWLCGCV